MKNHGIARNQWPKFPATGFAGVRGGGKMMRIELNNEVDGRPREKTPLIFAGRPPRGARTKFAQNSRGAVFAPHRDVYFACTCIELRQHNCLFGTNET